MTWIDDANRRLREQQERDREITEHEVEVYDALWDELKRHVEDARATLQGIRTNGQPLSHVVSLPVAPVPPLSESAPRTATVSLFFF